MTHPSPASQPQTPYSGRRSDGRDLERLTPREREVAELVGSGATNREVGARLFITESTVEFHMRNIFRKLRIRRRAQLAGLIAAHTDALTEGEGGDARL